MDEAALRLAPGARWALWQLPHRLLALVLTVETVALGLVVVIAARGPGAAGPVTPRDILLAVCLVLLSVVHVEVATGIERIRRRATDTTYFDLSSVWTFAAAVMLPGVLPAIVVILVYVHLWLRVWKPSRVPLYRHVYTTATVVLAAFAAQAVVGAAGGLEGFPANARGLAALVVAVFAYAGANIALVAAAIAIAGAHTRLSDVLGHWDDNALEIATLCLGALTAVALTANPWLVVLVLPPLLVLHRAVLVRQLEEAVRTDGKTGLRTAAAWHALAVRELRRCERGGFTAGVLVLDLDHFKAVNDVYGHLAGDDVLAAVGAALRAEVRDHDLVGRFGGEEFVVLLPDLPQGGDANSDVRAIAERIRRRIASLMISVATPDGPCSIRHLTVSIGGALYPEEGGSVQQLLAAADAAVYAAKRDGRNRVRMASTLPTTRPSRIPTARHPAP
ncbi:MAG: GGDEF domain-containing protein [Pseudonocardia sp.]